MPPANQEPAAQDEKRPITVAVEVDALAAMLAGKALPADVKKHYAKRVAYAKAREKVNAEFGD